MRLFFFFRVTHQRYTWYICRSQKGNSVNFEIDQSKGELTEWPVKKEISVSSKTVNFEIDCPEVSQKRQEYIFNISHNIWTL